LSYVFTLHDVKILAAY